MQGFASFFLLEKSKLDELTQQSEPIVMKTLTGKKVIDNYWDYLAKNAKELRDFDGPGYIYGNLLVFLQEEKNIDLRNEYEGFARNLASKRTSSHFLFTNTQKEKINEELDPGNFTITEVQKFNKYFSDAGDEETATLTLDALKVLHENLDEVKNEEQLLLLIVG